MKRRSKAHRGMWDGGLKLVVRGDWGVRGTGAKMQGNPQPWVWEEVGEGVREGGERFLQVQIPAASTGR